MKHQAATPDESREFAAYLAGILEAGDVVLLQGDLGTGKTFLVKEICSIWNMEDEAVSPSFAIIHQYSGPRRVNHFDFYRIDQPRELDNLGWEELLDEESVSFIEWPQLIEDQLQDYYKIDILLNGEGLRLFHLQRNIP